MEVQEIRAWICNHALIDKIHIERKRENVIRVSIFTFCTFHINSLLTEGGRLIYIDGRIERGGETGETDVCRNDLIVIHRVYARDINKDK